ncbi:DinB family protein [Rhabdaerophilum sp. SD176]|uniref:DinB family protein n=1 Tax=Rhabdaerophilum sp. SD176 TaxID=2983548 RepID=UPI0024DFD3B4|nr:DinB family protein [Rhabdaerophilum sp. SD176]
MIGPDHVRLMARYNAWQNRSLVTAADGLDDAARRLDRGAFFGSVFGTLNHIAWGDTVWMHRFTGRPKPPLPNRLSATLFPDWASYRSARMALDEEILDWAGRVQADWLAASQSWMSGAAGREVSRPNWALAAHFFNHQTHHRGQVHAMLTAAGAHPEDTDLFFVDPAGEGPP